MASKITAMVQTGGDSPKLVKDSITKPKPEAHQALVKVSYVAQNPTDVQSLDGNAFGDGTVLGCDFVGTVEETGSKVSRIAKGDVIAGLIWGGEIKGLGAYSEYTIADEKICFKVPKSIDLASAATVPLAAATAFLALFSPDCLAIDRKTEQGTTVLVWGGSSSVGLYALQIAAIFGFKTVTTCSPRNFDLVKSVGHATEVVDYNDKDVVSKIQKAAPDLKYIFDTIGNKDSSALASQALGKDGGVLCTVRPGKANTEKVEKRCKVTDVLVWTAFLKDHQYKEFKWPANHADHNLGSEFFESVPKWLQDGKLKPNNIKKMKGLESVPDGFQEHRDGKISAYKLVYEL